jgi:hypothetical protein
MTAAFLEKIEQLTLYSIEQDKKIEQLTRKLDELLSAAKR